MYNNYLYAAEKMRIVGTNDGKVRTLITELFSK